MEKLSEISKRNRKLSVKGKCSPYLGLRIYNLEWIMNGRKRILLDWYVCKPCKPDKILN
ncbi:hypothetical protein [Leptospira jelokensis]|uniref:hypothetical protein n=1 Tax=Leptospira jelokensis TaxID=2484931 RepID=UPI00142E6F1C|nr:hypothetical protein [Leptospira jelokensis]